MEPVSNREFLHRLDGADIGHIKKYFQAMLAVMADISSKLEIDELLPEIVHHATDLCDGEAGMIVLIDQAGAFTKRYTYRVPNLVDKITIPAERGIFYETIEKRRPLIVNDYPSYGEKIEGLALVGIKAMLTAPIIRKGMNIGVISILNLSPERYFTEYHSALLEMVSTQAAIAVENSRLYEAQRSISESLQKSMLPAVIPSIPHIEIGVQYSSATEEAIVGGDFYDIFDVDGKYAMVIGDVSGKGIEAASSTSMIKYVLRSYLYLNPSPSYALSQANKFVMREEERAPFITIFCAVYDPSRNTLTFSNAGHPHPCRLDQILKTCTILAAGDLAVGILDDYIYEEDTIVMNPGNFLVAYTDGVLEARANGEFFGEERLVNTLLENIDEPPQKIADSIIEATFEFSHGKLTDDIALLVIKKAES